MKKKLLLLPVFTLIMSLVPASALSADEDKEATEIEAVEEETETEAEEAETTRATEEESEATEESEAIEESGATEEATEETEAEESESEESAESGAVEEEATEEPVTTPAPTPTPIAEPAGPVTIVFVIGESSFTMTRNGIPSQIILDAPAFIQNGRTMVPLRAIAEAFNAEVDFDANAREIIIVRGTVNQRLSLNADLPGGLGRPALVNDRTFVPVNYVAVNLFGATVNWNEATDTVTIISNN